MQSAGLYLVCEHLTGLCTGLRLEDIKAETRYRFAKLLSSLH